MFLSCFYFLGFGNLFVALFGEYYLKIKKKTMYLENVLFINVVSGKYVSQDAKKKHPVLVKNFDRVTKCHIIP